MDDLHELFMAANYLEIESLLNGVAKRVADIIKACKNVEFMIRTKHIDRDMVKEEYRDQKIPLNQQDSFN
ncbi:SKP1-like protein 11 [Gossypium australe]|uniref:SKP1-like protein 11 n=1 Tax=Gossypium australe TaxID=47621 RepID=A0A5B6WKJ9_9ROSI|nr:SKP1-like protein 11 [Gossypium australe]